MDSTEDLIAVVASATDELRQRAGTAELDRLVSLVSSGEVRDVDWTEHVYHALFLLLQVAVKDAQRAGGAPDEEQRPLDRVAEVLLRMGNMPEFDGTAVETALTSSLESRVQLADLTDKLVKELMQGRSAAQQLVAARLLHWLYSCAPKLRRKMRVKIGNQVAMFSSNPWRGAGIGAALRLLVAILKGIGTATLPDEPAESAEAGTVASAALAPIGEEGSVPAAGKLPPHLRGPPAGALGRAGRRGRQPSTPEALARAAVMARGSLLRGLLLPLHASNAMLNDMVALLGLYHSELVKAMDAALAASPELKWEALQGVLDAFPTAAAPNSPKAVLLVHELEHLLDEHFAAQPADVLRSMQLAQDTLASLVRSEYARVSMRTVQMLADEDRARRLFDHALTPTLASLVAPVLAMRRPHWNGSTNKMMCAALYAAMEHASEAFWDLAARSPVMHWAEHRIPTKAPTALDEAAEQRTYRPSEPLDQVSGGAAAGVAAVATRATRGLGVPQIEPGAQPPVTVTGVAPWGGPGAQPAGGGAGGSNLQKWQAKVGGGAGASAIQHHKDMLALKQQREKVRQEQERQRQLDGLEAAAGERRGGVGLAVQRLLRLLGFPTKESLADSGKVITGETKEGGLTLTPTLLPELKFLDLVFGRDLGSGAFSKVRYCKAVMRGRPPSQWPELAAKSIATAVIKEHGYEASVVREVASLQVIAHPGVTRLVASFRYKDAAYLITEYASQGDLHSHITTLGSLSPQSARFAVGEVVAAVSAVHKAGFAFGDLKPENVVITESGHAKLTDFGGVRPINEVGKALLERSKGILDHMRDGGWRRTGQQASPERLAATGAPALPAQAATGGMAEAPTAKRQASAPAQAARPAMPAPPAAAAGTAAPAVDRSEDTGVAAVAAAGATPTDVQPAEVSQAEEERVEGTAAYMAPELVRGGRPTSATDAWALGCLVYFALAGRPPIWAETEVGTLEAVVRFTAPRHFPDDFPEDARDLVLKLLTIDPRERLGASGWDEIKQHSFFNALDCDCDSLYQHRPPKMKKGTAKPNAAAGWSRRQFSRLFSPMPAPLPSDESKAPKERAEVQLSPSTQFASPPGSLGPVKETTQEAGGLFTLSEL